VSREIAVEVCLAEILETRVDLSDRHMLNDPVGNFSLSAKRT
jgi:hypothetical protein